MTSINKRGLHIRVGIEKKLDAYRKSVKAATGKTPSRESVENELLDAALDGQIAGCSVFYVDGKSLVRTRRASQKKAR